MMLIDFNYMSGAGNLFTVINNDKYGLSNEELSNLAVKSCSGKWNKYIDTEGFLTIGKSNDADFSVKFFNPDGSSSMMCGNGARCSVRFAEFSGLIGNSHNVSFQMLDNIYSAEILKDRISVHFPAPVLISQDLKIETGDGTVSGDYIDVDSDHFVIHRGQGKVIEFADFGIDSKARNLRYNKSLPGGGANINILQNRDDGGFNIKTFERGVEKVTGACGTGAMSSAVSLFLSGDKRNEYSFHTPGNSILKVKFELDNDNISGIVLNGEAVILKHDSKDINVRELL